MLSLIAALSVASASPGCQAANPQSRGPAWERDSASLLQHVVDRYAPVLFIGDSISSLIGRQWAQDQSLPGNNLGVWGDASENVLWRIRHGAVDGLSPKVVLLMVGTNDWHYRCSPPQTIALIAAIVSELETRAPGASVIVAGALSRGHDPAPMAQLDALEATHFTGDRHVTYLRLRDLLLNRDGSLQAPLYREDPAVAVHPSPAGLTAIAGVLEPVILKHASR
jgi:beta-glucosidase